jgi:hypothetical protein
MPNTHQTSKHKWRREKFWAFMLLGLNRTLFHDPLPPWGFEFLIWINCQAWWQYTHYGFNAGYEPQSQDTQKDDKSSSDAASVGERPDHHHPGDEPEASGDRNSVSGFRQEGVSGGDIPQPSDVTEQNVWENRFQRPIEAPHCPICCTCTGTGVCTLRCSCPEKSEITALLPRFDWERDDDGQCFGDLL